MDELDRTLLNTLIQGAQTSKDNSTAHESMTKQEIFTLLQANKLIFSEDEILEVYKKTYSSELTLQHYFNGEYSELFELLDQNNDIFNSDMFNILLEKIVEDNFNLHEIPDSYYIVLDCETVSNKDYSQSVKMRKTFEILKRITEMGRLLNETNLDEALEGEYYDVGEFLCDMYSNFAYCHPEISFIKKHMELLDEFSKQFSESISLQLYLKTSLLQALVTTGNEVEIDLYKDILCKEYPEHPIQIYNGIFIAFLYKRDQRLIEKYYKECTSYKAINKIEHEFLKNINSIYKKF